MPPRETFGGGEARNRRGAAQQQRQQLGPQNFNGDAANQRAAYARATSSLDMEIAAASDDNDNDVNDKRSHSNDFVVGTALPLLVFIDMFAVSLVVPLLFQYYMMAGVANATQRELLSSVFSTSQIVGGLVFGALTDAKWLRRKTILYLSFGGSAVSYLMIAYGNFQLLLVSRVLVGLVKQTMTVTMSMITQFTTEDDRAVHLGRLQSAATAAWIAGPTVGAFLFTWDSKAPALAACGLFAIITVASAVLLPEDIETSSSNNNSNSGSGSGSMENNNSRSGVGGNSKKQAQGSFWENLKQCFSSRNLGFVIASHLLFYWINRSTSYSSMGSYYEDMYGLMPHHRGYIRSYQSVMQFIVQSALIGPVLQFVGGERQACCLATFGLAIATFAETQQSMPLFLAIICPIISLGIAMLTISLKALLTNIAPADSIFSVFAALDVLQNAAAVTVPFYRTQLFAVLPSRGADSMGMSGDPDAVAWAYSGAVHWLVASCAMTFLLMQNGEGKRRQPRKQRYTQNKTV